MMRIIRALGGFALIFVCGMFGAWLYGADIAVKLGGSDGIAALALLAILAVMIYIGLLTLANANFGETDFGFKHGLVAGGTTLVLAIGLFGLWRFAESISRIDPAIWWLLLASAITTGLVWFIFRYRASTA